MNTSAESGERPAPEDGRLPLLVKIVYGSGDWSLASFGTIRTILLGIFLADVVGIRPRLASIVLLVGVLWDALNDPLVGIISDRGILGERFQRRWGRRQTFLLVFAIPYGLSFLAMWVAPQWNSQLALLLHVTLAYALSDTFWTLVSVPFYALTPELTPDYDERTSLTTSRMLFNLVASLTTAVVAPEVVASAPDPRAGYLRLALIFGSLAVIPFVAIARVTRGIRAAGVPEETPPLRESFASAWRNVPFRYATAINLLNWVAVDLVALILPFFITYWLEGGNQRAQVAVPGVGTLAIQSVLFGIFLGTAVLALPLWWYLSRRFNKRTAYIAGMSFWLVVQLLFITVMPGQRPYTYLLAFLAGIGVSTAHVLPDALFPDVMEWDELMTGHRREGIYYGVRTFVRKVATAGVLALAFQVLGLFGYQQPPQGAAVFQQAPQTLRAIRLLAGPAGALLLLGAIGVAFFYPLSRERHARVRRLLARRKARAGMRA